MKSPVTLAPGIGFVNRTISGENMAGVADALRAYLEEDRFMPNHNVGGTFLQYCTIQRIQPIPEVTLKSNDIFTITFAEKREIIGSSIGKLEQKTGSVLYSSLHTPRETWYQCGSQRTENFNFRIDPNQRLLRGLVNFLPSSQQTKYLQADSKI
ncbi:MAG: hypothetical protein IPJ13_19580 [Saprospiraceae bacterium]|nr:hypothetical protein [Saprospiraceae bacterium]